MEGRRGCDQRRVHQPTSQSCCIWCDPHIEVCKSATDLCKIVIRSKRMSWDSWNQTTSFPTDVFLLGFTTESSPGVDPIVIFASFSLSAVSVSVVQ
ncbi:hypothetical protein VIGAN_01531700 [Vigna angularis var. angularis]|uniref:Uncharacterized protein n=1 Tax=Vigna angularis var. angularis TaxID=157739 RepID=A0A0S3R991_PHAAN|nr:hypothetical protein VIGAN_01531700 [Vigna angularis var. angularis]